MDEGTLDEWLVKPGDTVTRGQIVRSSKPPRPQSKSNAGRRAPSASLSCRSVKPSKWDAVGHAPGTGETRRTKAGAPGRTPSTQGRHEGAGGAASTVRPTAPIGAARWPPAAALALAGYHRRRARHRPAAGPSTLRRRRAAAVRRDSHEAPKRPRRPASGRRRPETKPPRNPAEPSRGSDAEVDRGRDEPLQAGDSALLPGRRDRPGNCADLADRAKRQPFDRPNGYCRPCCCLKAVGLAAQRFGEFNGFWRDDGFQPRTEFTSGSASRCAAAAWCAPAIHDVPEKKLTELMDDLTDLVARARPARCGVRRCRTRPSRSPTLAKRRRRGLRRHLPTAGGPRRLRQAGPAGPRHRRRDPGRHHRASHASRRPPGQATATGALYSSPRSTELLHSPTYWRSPREGDSRE